MRSFQMSRWINDHPNLRGLMSTVFKSWQSIVLICIFAIFSMAMFACIAMTLFGGSLGSFPQVTLADYPRRNVETFGTAFFQSLQFLSGESWSGTMYWYMEHSDFPQYAVAAFFACMYTWLNAILFSLFTAVLLVNFRLDEGEMMPKQRRNFEVHETEIQQLLGKSKHSRLAQLLNGAVTGPKRKAQKPTSFDLLKAFNDFNASTDRAQTGQLEMASRAPVFDLEPDSSDMGLSARTKGGGSTGQQGAAGTASSGLVDSGSEIPLAVLTAAADKGGGCGNNRSLYIFATSNRFRLLLARIEGHPWFDKIVILVVLFSCFVVALEDPSLMADYKIFFDIFNHSMLGIFVLEALIKCIVHGFAKESGPTLPYIASGANRLDLFVIVIISVTYVFPLGGSLGRALRLLRVMAPMLELLKQQEIRALVYTFYLALPQIGGVLFLLIIIFVVFGIIGVEFFGANLYSCVHAHPTTRCSADPAPRDCVNGLEAVGMPLGDANCFTWEEVPGKVECLARMNSTRDALWLDAPFSFNNILEALLSLFYLATGEGWVDMMEAVIDSTSVDQSPVRDHSPGFQYYFFAFNVVFKMFMLNLFIGVLGNAFSQQSGSNLLTPAQIQWIRAKVMLKTYTPNRSVPSRPETGRFGWRVRQKAWDLTQVSSLERLWTAGILINVAVLLLEHYPSFEEFEIFVEVVNFACLLIFTAEFLLKLVGFGLRDFLKDGWQRLDLFVICGSWLSVGMGMKGGASVIRSFRTVRLALLVKRMPGLMTMVETVISCIVPSLNICAMSSMVFYFYAVLGMRMFGEATMDRIGGFDNNFDTFLSSLKLLFQSINGQTLYAIVWDMREFGKVGPALYFISFYFLLVFLGMNLLVVVVLENFAILASIDQGHFSVDDLDIFLECFLELTLKQMDAMDDPNLLADLMCQLEPGMPQESVEELAKQAAKRLEDKRQRQWLEFVNKFEAEEWQKEDALFHGWLRIEGQKEEYFYFWVDSDCQKRDSAGYRCLNWYTVPEKNLESTFAKGGKLKVNRVRVTQVATDLVTPYATAVETLKSNNLDHLNDQARLSAALSGHTWYLSLLKSKIEQPNNIAAKFFDTNYYNGVLADPSLNDQHGAAIGLHLTDRVETYLVDEHLTTMQAKFRQCIEVGVLIPTCGDGEGLVPSGCCICEPDDYENFWPFFSQVLAHIHEVDMDVPVDHSSDWELDLLHVTPQVSFFTEIEQLQVDGSVSPQSSPTKMLEVAQEAQDSLRAPSSPRSPAAEEESLLDNFYSLEMLNVTPKPVTMSVWRNIELFTMVATLSITERVALEELVESALTVMLIRPEWAGRYVSLTPGHGAEIGLNEYKDLVKDGLLFPPANTDPLMVAAGLAADWPFGRGAYISADEKTVVHVGYEDHIAVHAIDGDCNRIDILLERLKVSLGIIEKQDTIVFRRDPLRCGYICSAPKHAGTGMQAYVDLPLKYLTVDGTTRRVREVVRDRGLNLEIRSVPTDPWLGLSSLCTDIDDDHVVRIAVKRTYGCTEAQTIQSLFRDVGRLAESDRREEMTNRISRKVQAAARRREVLRQHINDRFEDAVAVAKTALQLEARDNDGADGVGDYVLRFTVTPQSVTHKVVSNNAFTVVADSEEQRDSWIVLLQWLAAGCKGPPPYNDEHLRDHNIVPRRITTLQWYQLQSNVTLLDMPFEYLRSLFLKMQRKGILRMVDGHNREYLIYATFQIELYAYRTEESRLAAKAANTKKFLNGCHGVNMSLCLHRLVMLNYGKVQSLTYRESMEENAFEMEYVALRIIQAAVSEWMARWVHKKKPGQQPHGRFSDWWRKHSSVYLIAIRAARDTRLRTLKLLLKLVRRMKPDVPQLVDYYTGLEGEGLAIPFEQAQTSKDGEEARREKDIFGDMEAQEANANDNVEADFLNPLSSNTWTNGEKLEQISSTSGK
jgi:hypothetical protein